MTPRVPGFPMTNSSLERDLKVPGTASPVDCASVSRRVASGSRVSRHPCGRDCDCRHGLRRAHVNPKFHGVRPCEHGTVVEKMALRPAPPDAKGQIIQLKHVAEKARHSSETFSEQFSRPAATKVNPRKCFTRVHFGSRSAVTSTPTRVPRQVSITPLVVLRAPPQQAFKTQRLGVEVICHQALWSQDCQSRDATSA